MNFTFGIITDGSSPERITQIIRSIENNYIPEYEIIIIGGGPKYEYRNTKVIEFNENTKSSWITRKKNLITLNAKYENIVYLHDYITFDHTWYQGFLRYGNNFNICINPIKNNDGTRYRDLTFFPGFRGLCQLGFDTNYNVDCSADLHLTVQEMDEHECLIPYENYKECIDTTKWMYISGAYWVAKGKVMREFPLNEGLSWGQGEDVLWSAQIKSKYTFSFNPYSINHLLKQKDPVFKILTPQTVKQLQNRGMLK